MQCEKEASRKVFCYVDEIAFFLVGRRFLLLVNDPTPGFDTFGPTIPLRCFQTKRQLDPHCGH